MTLTEIGAWLRHQREARNWSQREMARRLIQAGRASGDNSMPSLDSMYRNVHRWERGETGLSERYRLYYCKALDIPAAQFSPHASSPVIPAQPLSPANACSAVPDLADPRLLASIAVADERPECTIFPSARTTGTASVSARTMFTLNSIVV